MIETSSKKESLILFTMYKMEILLLKTSSINSRNHLSGVALPITGLTSLLHLEAEASIASSESVKFITEGGEMERKKWSVIRRKDYNNVSMTKNKNAQIFPLQYFQIIDSLHLNKLHAQQFHYRFQPTIS